TFVNFDIVWRYFSWTNQALATVVLWTIVVYLNLHKRNIWVALPPAVFMTYICSSFVFVSNQFVGLGSTTIAYALGGVVTLLLTALMCYKLYADRKKGLIE
ncbi:MAG: carbon starvation protein A, partial [Alistipes sp.]|nr:carbon starvation protein A [Alistipes sp.]